MSSFIKNQDFMSIMIMATMPLESFKNMTTATGFKHKEIVELQKVLTTIKETASDMLLDEDISTITNGMMTSIGELNIFIDAKLDYIKDME